VSLKQVPIQETGEWAGQGRQVLTRGDRSCVMVPPVTVVVDVEGGVVGGQESTVDLALAPLPECISLPTLVR